MVQQTSGTDRSGIGWSFGRQPLQRYEENLADHSYIWTAEWYAKDGNDSLVFVILLWILTLTPARPDA